MRFVFFVPIAGNVVAMLFSTLVYVFALLSLGLLVGTKAENQMQALQMSMVFMLPSVFFSGFIFPARNHAVDFLCARRALSHDLFHRAHARHHFARRKSPRILAEPCRSHSDVDLALLLSALCDFGKRSRDLHRRDFLFSAYFRVCALSPSLRFLRYSGGLE